MLSGRNSRRRPKRGSRNPASGTGNQGEEISAIFGNIGNLEVRILDRVENSYVTLFPHVPPEIKE
jgi:hypothetical protein